MGTTDGSWQYSGWNVDDMAISGLDSYVNPAGEVGFSSETYTVSEGSGSAVITIDRNGGTMGAVSVDYATSDGTAIAGADYTAALGTLSWADGDGNSKTFNVPLTDDSAHEDFVETINITLTNTVSATMIDPNPVTLNVEDNDNNAPDVYAGDDQTVEWQDVTPTAGLYYGTVSGAYIDISTPNPEAQILLDVGSETENSIAGNTTEIYTGFIYDADGQISFTEHIDDSTRIWIDDVLVLSDDAWRDRASTANLNLTPGWHTIEIRIFNGSGGSGPVSSPGIGYDPAGGTAWQTLVDPGDSSLLKVNQNISGADATLDGTVSDLDGDPFTAFWSVVSGPGSVTFDDATAAVTNAQFGAIGTYTLRLTADDGREQSTDDVVITVGFAGIILEIDEASISENGGSSNATVSRFASSGDLIVDLSSDDTSEATVPASVTILDGQTSANFTITAQDDAVADGTQNVTITATSAGNPDETASLDITDDEVAALTLAIVATAVSESDGASATTATVTRNTDTTSELIVNLSSNDTSEASVPATVTIAAGQTSSPSFSINAIDDSIVDGTQTVTVTASFSGLADGTDALDVTDDVPLTLTVVTGAGGVSTSGGGLKDPDGSPYAISATADTNYSFVNWSVTAGSATVDNENSANTFVFATGDATVQANFAAGTYTVLYSGNGSDGGSVPVDASSPYDNGSSVTVLDNTGSLTRTGYTFAGWNTASDGSGSSYVADDTFSISSNTTLYAQWTINTHNVTYDGNGSDGGDVPTDGSNPYDYSSTVTVLGNAGSLTRTDYTFLGWNTANDGSGTDYVADDTFTITGDATLYANWNNIPSVDAGAPQTVYITGSDVDWTPADATTSLTAWYDASDSNNVTTSGTTVTSWNDSSVNGYHLNEVGSSGTIYDGSQINGLNVINLSSTFSELYRSGIPDIDVTQLAVISVGMPKAAGDSPNLGSVYSTDGSDKLALRLGNNDTSGKINMGLKLDGTNTGMSTGNSIEIRDDVPVMLAAYYDGFNGVSRVNGGALSVTVDVADGKTFTINEIQIGRDSNTPRNYHGEMIVLNTSDSATIQKVEGYLAWKWGMQAKLPAAHPYSTTNATSGPKKSVPSATATLAGTVTDLDDTPSVTWSDAEMGTGTGTVIFADPNDPNSDVTFSDIGTYILRLTANDGFHQPFDEVEITVALPPLAVTIADAEISEDGGTTTATITRIGTTGDLEITLASSDIGEATVPATTSIPNGDTSVDVTITGVPDGIIDGTETVTITATAENNAEGIDTVDVTNVDLETFTVTYDGNTNDGGSVPVDASSPYDDGSIVTVLGNTGSLAKTGYHFTGWNTASDGSGTSYAADDTFTITQNVTLFAQWLANTAPVADDQTVSTVKNTVLAITLTASDTDLDTLSYAVVTQPVNGTLSGTAPDLTYTPGADYSGSDSFTFTANDGNADSNLATVSITVQTPFEGWVGGGSSPTTDSSGDGISDGMAWVLGASGPSSDASVLLPTSDTLSEPDYFIVTYRRSDEAHNATNTTIDIVYGSDMTSWSMAVHDGTNVVISETDDFYAPGVDRVEVKINWDLVTGDKIFTRLRVEIVP
jgi:uncharacterized repeat protein (TIGR02543 family)